MEKYDIVLIAYSDIIIDALNANKIKFILCYPEINAKQIYIERYKKRGNNQNFINSALEGYEEAVQKVKKTVYPKIELCGEETLEDYLIKNNYELKKIEQRSM